MASITMDLWEVLELTDNIGLDDYPLFDPSHRDELNEKITRRYWNREIGHETIDQFIWNMRRKMHEIMPYYNQLYASEQVKYDPLATIDIQTIAKGNTESSNEGNTAATSGSKTKASGIAAASDFPQTSLNGDGEEESAHVGQYATSSSESRNEGEQDNTASENRKDAAKGKSDSDSRTTGYQGVPAQLIMDYRRAILNVDLMVVDALNELFLSVLNTPNQYSSDRNYF